MCSDAAAESFATHPYLADALYKISLAHILQYGRSIDPMKLTIKIDGAEEHTVYDKAASIGGYPFANALTIKEKIDVPRALRTEQVMNVVLNASRTAYMPKSKEARTDERFDRAARGARSAALVALLLSKTKSPDVALDLYEGFTYLWTAMNGCYNSFQSMKCAEKREQGKPGAVINTESEMIDHCLGWHQLGSKGIVRKDHAKAWEQAASSFEKLSDDVRVDEYKEEELERRFSGLSNWLKGETENEDIEKRNEEPLYEDLTIRGYLTFCLPYHLRCIFVHGENMPPLFACSTDARYRALRLCSDIMEQFLDENLSARFEDDWLESRRGE